MASESKTLNVKGMSCQHCVHAVKDAVGALKGVTGVDVDLTGGKVSVAYSAEEVKLDQIKKAIEDAGYQVV
jgi:copper chaperone